MGSINVHGLGGTEIISHKNNPKNIPESLCLSLNMSVFSSINVAPISDVFSECIHPTNDHYGALMASVKNCPFKNK